MTTYPINTSMPLSACFSVVFSIPLNMQIVRQQKKKKKKGKENHPRTYFSNTNFSAKLLLSDGNLCSLMRLYRKCATKFLSLFYFFPLSEWRTNKKYFHTNIQFCISFLFFIWNVDVSIIGICTAERK